MVKKERKKEEESKSEKFFTLQKGEREVRKKKFFKTFQSCAITNFRKILFIIQN